MVKRCEKARKMGVTSTAKAATNIAWPSPPAELFSKMRGKNDCPYIGQHR